MRVLLFLLDLFFSRSRCFKDEEMNRFSKRGDPIENRRTPDASKRSIQRRRRRRRTSSSRRMRKPSFTERQKRKHARSARVKEVHSTSKVRAHTREREKEKEMNQTRIVKKTTTTSQTRTRSRIFLRDEQPFKRAVPVPLEDVGEVFDRFFGGFVEP